MYVNVPDSISKPFWSVTYVGSITFSPTYTSISLPGIIGVPWSIVNVLVVVLELKVVDSLIFAVIVCSVLGKYVLSNWYLNSILSSSLVLSVCL